MMYAMCMPILKAFGLDIRLVFHQFLQDRKGLTGGGRYFGQEKQQAGTVGRTDFEKKYSQLQWHAIVSWQIEHFSGKRSSVCIHCLRVE